VKKIPKNGEKKIPNNGQLIHKRNEEKKSPKTGIVCTINVLFLVTTSK
jgi:hypothetical protein